MIRTKTISLVIPCRNEEHALEKLLKRVPKYVDEVIVVDNGSTDNTSRVAKKLGAKVIHELRTDSSGIGYGYAHQNAIHSAKGDYIVALDGDNTYPVNKILPALNFLEKNELLFLSCSRFPLKRNKAISWLRIMGVLILNAETSFLYGVKIQDILSGMWISNAKYLKDLPLKSGGWNFSPEIKITALYKNRSTFGEFHIPHSYRYDGKSKQKIWKTGFDHLTYILGRRLFFDNFIAASLVGFAKNAKLQQLDFQKSLVRN